MRLATGIPGPYSLGSYTLNGVLYGNGTDPLLVTAQGPANSVLTANAGAPAFSETPTLNGLTVVDYIVFDNTDVNVKIGFTAGKNLVVGAQYNVSLGYQANTGHATLGTSGADYNVAIGYRALFNNRSGFQNFALGANALVANTSGTYNVAIGSPALEANTSGAQNVAIGANALGANTTAGFSVAIAPNALVVATGARNIGIGANALGSLTSGASAIGIGVNAGRYITGGVTANQTSLNSVYIGDAAYALANGDTNEIVIGFQAVGGGSNTATLGNTSITTTFLRGNVGIGQTTVAGITSRLHLPAGTATANTAPLQFTSGTLETVARAGVVEFLTDAWYGVITTGAVRKTFAFLESPALVTPNLGTPSAGVVTNLTGTASININGTVGAGTPAAATVTTFATTGQVTLGAPATLKAYTVGTLPAGVQGDVAYVTDALDPTFLVAVIGGGAIVCPVFRNATAWVAG